LDLLITGATGFIGRHTVDEALRRGLRPRVLLRHPLAEGNPWRGRVLECIADLRRAEGLEAACRGVGGVVHLAGLTRARSFREFLAVNGEAVGVLAREVSRHGAGEARFLLVSSLAAAGPGTPDRPRRPEDVPEPVSPYGRSKLLGERRLREEGRGLSWTILRPPIVHGPWDRDLLMLFAMVRRGLVLDGAPPGAAYSLLFGPDLARALLDLALGQQARGEVHHPAEARAYRQEEIVAAIAAALEVPLPRGIRIPAPLSWVAALAGSLAAPWRRRPPFLRLAKLREVRAPGWVADPRTFAQALPDWTATPFESAARLTARSYLEQEWLPAPGSSPGTRGAAGTTEPPP
jgi:dihydroflavonol-4-reductase